MKCGKLELNDAEIGETESYDYQNRAHNQHDDHWPPEEASSRFNRRLNDMTVFLAHVRLLVLGGRSSTNGLRIISHYVDCIRRPPLADV